MRTWFAERFGVKTPIISGPMAPHAVAFIAGAVFRGGAFGDTVPSIERFHHAGIQVAEHVQLCALAEAADDAKVDLVVALEKEES